MGLDEVLDLERQLHRLLVRRLDQWTKRGATAAVDTNVLATLASERHLDGNQRHAQAIKPQLATVLPKAGARAVALRCVHACCRVVT
jgi:hypothetical protein